MRTEVLELTEEQLKTLNLFSYYSRGYGGDEVTKEYYFEDGSWSLNDSTVPRQVYDLMRFFITLPEFQLK